MILALEIYGALCVLVWPFAFALGKAASDADDRLDRIRITDMRTPSPPIDILDHIGGAPRA